MPGLTGTFRMTQYDTSSGVVVTTDDIILEPGNELPTILVGDDALIAIKRLSIGWPSEWLATS